MTPARFEALGMETYLEETKQTLTHFEGVVDLQFFNSQENYQKAAVQHSHQQQH